MYTVTALKVTYGNLESLKHVNKFSREGRRCDRDGGIGGEERGLEFV